MQHRFHVMPLRGGLLSKLFAAWFVVSIELPFTALFQVYDGDAPIEKTTPAEKTVHVRQMRHRLRRLPVLPTVLRL